MTQQTLRSKIVVEGDPRGIKDIQNSVRDMAKAAERDLRIANIAVGKYASVISNLKERIDAIKATGGDSSAQDAALRLIIGRYHELADTADKYKDVIVRTKEDETTRMRAVTTGLKNQARERRDAAKAELRDARDLARDIARVERAEGRAAAHEEKDRDRAKGAFAQGFAQSLSPTMGGFLQRGPGMVEQYIGQMIGGMIRQAIVRPLQAFGGMVAGGGPTQSIVGAIPVVGSVLSGAAGLADASAQTAIDYYKTRRQAAPFIGGYASPSRAAMAAAGRVQFAESMIPQRALVNTPIGQIGTDFGRWAGSGLLGAWRMTTNPIDYFATSGAETEQTAAAARAQESGLPVSRFKNAIGERTRRAAVLDLESVGRNYGLTRRQTLAAAGQAGQRYGGTMTGDLFGQIQGAEALGIGADTTASFLRQQRPGRGGTGTSESFVRVLGDGVAQGLKAAEVDEYLKKTASAMEHSESQGMKIDPESFSRLATVAGTGMGLGGLQGARIAEGLTAGVQGIGLRGAAGPVDVAVMRAMGFDPTKRGQYAQFTKATEGGFSAEQMATLVRSLAGNIGDTTEAGLIVSRALRPYMDIPVSQAEKMVINSRTGMPVMQGVINDAKEKNRDIAGLRVPTTMQGLGEVWKSVGAYLTPEKKAAEAEDIALGAGMKTMENVQRVNTALANMADSLAAITTSGVADTFIEYVGKMNVAMANLLGEDMSVNINSQQ